MRVELCVDRAVFADTLGAMRAWLDNRHCPPVRFETASDGGLVTIMVEFSADDLGEAFRQAFDGSAA